LKKLTTIFALSLALVLLLGISINSYAADNDASQVASTDNPTCIQIVDKETKSSLVSTITFPQGSPGTTVSDPYNNIDGIDDPQVLSDDGSEPVVVLYNSSSSTYNITLEITSWTNSVVASECYELANTTQAAVDAVDEILSSDGAAATVDTGIQLEGDAYKSLYLEITLGATGGTSGSSTLTVLAES